MYSNQMKINAMLFIEPTQLHDEDYIRKWTEINAEDEENWAKYQEFLKIEHEPLIKEEDWEKYLLLVAKLQEVKWDEKNSQRTEILLLIEIRDLVNNVFGLDWLSEHQWFFRLKNAENTPDFRQKAQKYADEVTYDRLYSE